MAEFVPTIIMEVLLACGLNVLLALRVVETWKLNVVVVVWEVPRKQSYHYYS